MAIQQGYFITGTDTGVGKTLISCAIIHKLVQQGHRVQGMKPVAAGAIKTSQGLRNDDALQLMNACHSTLDYALINPFCYEAAIAPHIAAQETGQAIDMQRILNNFRTLRGKTDYVIVEGAGGWLVPINARQTLADLATALQLPVILVVGIRLGCLNHALLTERAIRESRLPLAGWVANIIDSKNLSTQDNITYLEKTIKSPLLGTIPYRKNIGFKPLSEKLKIPHVIHQASL